MLENSWLTTNRKISPSHVDHKLMADFRKERESEREREKRFIITFFGVRVCVLKMISLFMYYFVVVSWE